MSTRRGLRRDDLTQGGPTMATMTTNIVVLGHFFLSRTKLAN